MANVRNPRSSKPSGFKKDGTPTAAWTKFIQRMEIYKNLEPKNWTVDQLLGYNLSKYEEVYNVKWTLSFSGAPTKCTEIYCMKRMLTELAVDDMAIAKNYIDWIWVKKIIPRKLELKSLGFFFTRALINEYKMNRAKFSKITRSKELPNPYIKAANDFGLTMGTYGDLAFANMAIAECGDDVPDEYRPYIAFFNWLDSNGFDRKVLDKL